MLRSRMRSLGGAIHALLNPTWETRLRVERRTVSERTVEGRTLVVQHATYQTLVEVTTRNGRPWSRRVLDREQVPDHVMITLGCFGDTGGWLSRFKDVIADQRERETSAA